MPQSPDLSALTISLLAIPVLGLVVLAAGCATVSSGIEPAADPDGYVLTERVSPLQGGAAKAGRTAMTKADVFCRGRGGRLVPIDTADVGWPIQREITGPTGITLRFRCGAAREQQLNVGEAASP